MVPKWCRLHLRHLIRASIKVRASSTIYEDALILMLTVFGAVAELEREYILQRQREGIAIAKEQGKYKGRKPIVSPEFEQVTAKWRSGTITAAEAMRTLHMTKTTFYRRVKQT